MSDIPTSPSEISYDNISTLKYFYRILFERSFMEASTQVQETSFVVTTLTG